MAVVRLESSDKTIFEVEERIASFSGTIRCMIDVGVGCNQEKEIIPLIVEGPILRKCIDWIEYHASDGTISQLYSVTKDIRLCSWDRKFLKIDQLTRFKITLAAQYLDIQALYKLMCWNIAEQVKGKSPEKLREHFNLPNDLPNK